MRHILTLLAVTTAILIPAGTRAQNASVNLGTVTLDAGHGGNDPGCISADKSTKEKDVALLTLLTPTRRKWLLRIWCEKCEE